MILILGLLFDGCVVGSLFVVEDEAIVDGEDEKIGDCDEVKNEKRCLNNQVWLWFGQSMH